MPGASSGDRTYIGVAMALAVGILAARGCTPNAVLSAQARPPAGATPVNRYVNPASCAQCHAGIATSFRLNGMGRSFYRPGPQNLVENFKSGNPFYHEASNSYFAMLERDRKYYQRRWQIGHDGKETNIEEKEIHFVLGSGNHARTYLHLT